MIDIETIVATRRRLKPYLHMTPLLYSTLLNREFKKHIWLKLETQLPTGTFKPRPAFNGILSHLDQAREHGVIAPSSGNFAQGVAYAAHELGVSAMIVMEKRTSAYKVQRTKAFGAEVILSENNFQDQIETTLRLQKETQRVLLHPYNSFETIAGDGTIGLELSDQLGEKLTQEEVTVLVPVSGGGLIAGIAFALKKLHPRCKIIGLQPEANPSLLHSFQAGKCVTVTPQKTIADALLIPTLGDIAFPFIQQYVDDVVVIPEEKIQQATQYMIEQHKLVVEPSAAITVAALFAEKITAKNIICIISGGNVPLLIN